MAAAEATRRLLVETTVQQLAATQDIVILTDTTTVDEALQTLARKRILSAPVVALETQQPDESAATGGGDIVGFVDIRDILSSFLTVINGSINSETKLLQKMRYLEEKGLEFSALPLKDLAVSGTDGDFLHKRQARASLLELISYGLLDPKHRGAHGGKNLSRVVHRVALFDNHSHITHIISQSDIIRFLTEHGDDMGGMASHSVADLGWAQRSVVAVTPETSAIEALRVMDDAKISGVAVVDAVGKIIGNFSVSDMRTIMAEHFGALALPVGEFLAREHGTEFHGYKTISDSAVTASSAHKFATDRLARQHPRVPGEEVGQALVMATGATTLREVMQSMVSSRVHRVYVVDEEERPVGIITCTDVLRKMVEVSGI